MKNILYQLYDGFIDVSKIVGVHTPEVETIRHQVIEHEQMLLETLNEEQKELLERLQDEKCSESAVVERENFVCGWRLGAQFMLESMQDSGSNQADEPVDP